MAEYGKGDERLRFADTVKNEIAGIGFSKVVGTDFYDLRDEEIAGRIASNIMTETYKPVIVKPVIVHTIFATPCDPISSTNIEALNRGYLKCVFRTPSLVQISDEHPDGYYLAQEFSVENGNFYLGVIQRTRTIARIPRKTITAVDFIPEFAKVGNSLKDYKNEAGSPAKFMHVKDEYLSPVTELVRVLFFPDEEVYEYYNKQPEVQRKDFVERPCIVLEPEPSPRRGLRRFFRI